MLIQIIYKNIYDLDADSFKNCIDDLIPKICESMMNLLSKKWGTNVLNIQFVEDMLKFKDIKSRESLLDVHYDRISVADSLVNGELLMSDNHFSVFPIVLKSLAEDKDNQNKSILFQTISKVIPKNETARFESYIRGYEAIHSHLNPTISMSEFESISNIKELIMKKKINYVNYKHFIHYLVILAMILMIIY